MTTTHRFARYVGGQGTLAPRGWEFKGPCQHCGRDQPYIFMPEGSEALVCNNPKCKKVIAAPFPEPGAHSQAQATPAEAAQGVAAAAAADAAKKPKKLTPQQQVTAQLARFAQAGTCDRPGCGKEVWWWNSTNNEGKPTKYIFDRNPRMVFGVKFGPDGTTVVGIEKRTCWINHWDTCANRPK